MSLTTGEMTPADLAAVTGNNNNDGFGGNGAWWIIILFLFCFAGWGNGYGGFGGGSQGAADNYVLASDFATLQRQIDSGVNGLERKGDSIQNGLCDGFYAMNTSLLNGFAGVTNAVTTNGYDTRNAIQSAQVSQMQSANALQAQIAQCCCDNREAISGVNYNMAMNANATQNAISNGFCQTNFNAQTNARDIIDNQNSNARAILDALSAQQLEAKNEKIAEQTQQINALSLAASQAAQNNYLISALRPSPIPAYQVQNPYTAYGYGCNYGCNCT